MLDTVANFIKNADVVTILNFLVVAVCVLIGFALFIFAGTRVTMRLFLWIGIVPLLSGILALWLKFKYANAVMFGLPTAQSIAANRREGVVDLIVGGPAAIAILLMRALRQRLNKSYG